MKNFSEKIKYIGVDDEDIDLFEGQYVVPNGMCYNSYLINDEKIAVMDTVDKRRTQEWLKNVETALDGKQPDYLIVSHVEPDHSASIAALLEKYPDVVVVGNTKTFAFAEQFFGNIFKNRLTVNEGDTLNLGTHELQFMFAPMVHWPEVTVSYEKSEKVLFSADAFGKFGTADADEPWDCEARRYYFNIVGKYGAQVQALLKKVAAVDIAVICPLHGPVLTENLSRYIAKYDIWSAYKPENSGVLIAYTSIYGNTADAAKELARVLESHGEKVAVTDLSRDDVAEAVEDAFRYDRLVIATTTYDGGIFPAAEHFVNKLKVKNYQNRRVAFIENGTWAATAARLMRAQFETMKNITFCETTVTVKSSLKGDYSQISALAAELVKKDD